jgi:glycosyltransferase involved in cell wall biosynthesis
VRILWVATKAPAPPVDGGRLVSLLTLEALKEHGHELTVVSPIDAGAAVRSAIAARLEGLGRVVLVPARPSGLVAAALRTVFGATPLTVLRHASPAVRDRVEGLLSRESFDVVHAEQPQALAQVRRAEGLRVPVVLRAQNVESDLWGGASRTAGLLRPALAREARRLAAFEGRAVREAAATVALTACDASRLAELSGAADRVTCVPAPFPSRLPPAARPLAGAPAVLLFGSSGWRPNEEGARWFLGKVWPLVRAALPEAGLHVVGAPLAASAGVLGRAAPEDSRELFAEGAVLVVPLHVASGVRMKILEAWARGVPVVATRAGARGLDATDGRELLLADEPEAFVLALRRLHAEAGLAAALVAAGRERLAARHEPGAVAARLTEVYARAASSVGR